MVRSSKMWIQGEKELADFITGTYKYQIDPKGRVRIPSKLKEVLGQNLYIGYGAGDYLVVYTNQSVNVLSEKYANISVFDPMYDSVREIVGNIFSFTADNQERYQIPLAMRDRVGLKDEIVFVAVFNKLEIWSAENYAKRKDKSVSQSHIEDYKGLL